MKQQRNILQSMADRLDLTGEPVPGEPLVEIAGDGRVLIENHHGVREYHRDRIGINVKFGTVLVCGTGLELARMTKEQLVITGRIHGVSLLRRNKG